MTKLINKDKLDIFTNKLWERITKSFVSKTLPNTVTGETMITDGYVGGESTITKRHNETRATMVGLGVETGYFGIPSLSIPARTHIDKIVCIMHDSAGDIGTTATGVNVGVVSKSTGRLLEYLKRGETTEIIENPISSGTNALTGDKAISIPINRTWEEEVYFIVGAKGLLVGYINSFTISIGGDELKDVGYEFGNGTAQNYVGRIAIYTSKYSLNEVATKAFTSETDINTLKNDYVSKTKENLVSSKTTLLNGCILNSAISTVNNTNATFVMTDSRFAGSPSLTAGGNVHISYLCVAVDDSYEIGREISGIKIAAVNYDTNRVKEVITTTGKATVCENIYGHIDSRRVILYPIQKSYDVGVYFIVGFYGMKWGQRSNSNWLTVVPSTTFPSENAQISINTSNWIYQAAIFAEETKLNEMLTSINTLSTSKAGISSANTFTNTNTFNGTVRLNENVDIRYVTKYEQLLLGGDSTRGSDWAVYFDREIYIPAGSYVTYLDIRVTDDVNVGTELSDVYIYEVQRGDDIRNDSIVGLPNNLRFRIFDVAGYGKCIRVQFNRKFNRDTYCIIGQKMSSGKILMGNDAKGDIRRAITGKPFVLNYSHNVLSESRPTNNKVIHRYTIERVGILQDDIKNINNVLATTVKNTDVGNEANKIPRIGADGRLPSSILPPEQNGGVRMVNGRSPESNGNVTVLAEHIKYHADTDITVKRAIDNKVNETDTVTSSQAHKIVKLDSGGKINDNMMPLTVAKRINNLDVNNNAVTIYSDNIAIDSSNPNKNIKQALDERAHKNQDNIFTKRNTFNDYSPRVNRVFTRASFRDNLNTSSITALTDSNAIYFANLSDKYNKPNKPISHLILPIKNARVGDTVSVRCFVFNNNNTILQIQNWFRNYTVEDIDMVGCKCIKIPFEYTPTGSVGFGFAIEQNAGGLGAACVRNSSGVHSWTHRHNPQQNQTISPNSNIAFPYKICYATTSELVTRFELEEVTQMYPKTLIGEYKNISYDAGNTLDDGTNTWLKANGQAVTNTDYPELFEKLNPNRTINDLDNIQVETFELPNETAAAGYYYICAK